MIDRAQRTFWDWASRNAIRLGTIVAVAQIVARAALRKGKRNG